MSELDSYCIPCASVKTRGIQSLGISKGEIAGAVIVRHNDGLVGVQSWDDEDYPDSTIDVALVW